MAKAGHPATSGTAGKSQLSSSIQAELVGTEFFMWRLAAAGLWPASTVITHAFLGELRE